MIDVLTVIYNKLKEYHARVYQNVAPQTSAIFPYVVFRVPSINEKEIREDIILEIDIWDNISDTTRLETLTTQIAKGLNRYKYIDGKMQLSSYKINQLNIPDPDQNINRRQLRFNLQTYILHNYT